MKSKLFGFVLIVVATLLALYYAGGNILSQGGGDQGDQSPGIQTSQQADVTLQGYLGGEKIGLFENPEAAKVMANKYGVAFDYRKAGSLAMVDADHTGMNYLFPSSQTALDLYERQYGKPAQSEIIFNTPIVIYSHQPVRQALQDQGMVTEEDGVYYMDMQALVAAIAEGKSWADVGLPQLYGAVHVQTTHPSLSNSGSMFSGLIANVLNGGRVVTEADLPQVLPQLTQVYSRLGYMEKSSADLFDQFLRTGMGVKPMIAGYESQILEFAVQEPETWEQIKDDIVIIYPRPTVWSSHVYIALDNDGKRGIPALMDDEVQTIAWEQHGYRTSYYGAGSEINQFGVDGVATDLTQIAPMPDSAVMSEIIDALS